MNGILSKIEAFLDGKKTYFLAISAVLGSLVAYLNHSISLNELIAAIWAALTAGSLRSGIGNTNPK